MKGIWMKWNRPSYTEAQKCQVYFILSVCPIFFWWREVWWSWPVYRHVLWQNVCHRESCDILNLHPQSMYFVRCSSKDIPVMQKQKQMLNMTLKNLFFQFTFPFLFIFVIIHYLSASMHPSSSPSSSAPWWQNPTCKLWCYDHLFFFFCFAESGKYFHYQRGVEGHNHTGCWSPELHILLVQGFTQNHTLNRKAFWSVVLYSQLHSCSSSFGLFFTLQHFTYFFLSVLEYILFPNFLTHPWVLKSNKQTAAKNTAGSRP